MRLELGGDLRGRLKGLVLSHPAQSTPGLKWHLLRSLSDLLLQNENLFEKGCWDFFDDDHRALRDYDMWFKGMTTEEGARTEPSGWLGGLEPRFMTFTIALLLAGGTRCARDLSRVCEIPEDSLWKKETFVAILRGLTRVNYAAVKSDVLYLIPGDESWGLTAKDLADQKFDYLRTLS
jgi:hypothetical protein